MLRQRSIGNSVLLHPLYPEDWAVMYPEANLGDRVIYLGSIKELRGETGVINYIGQEIKKGKSGSIFDAVFEWRYTIVLDDGKGTLYDVREKSFTKISTN